MNKTVTINISGIIFHIEEDAYQTLSNYLSKIKGYFSKTDGGNEIMADIESRIAELLQQKINTSKQVVLMVDVEHVMNTMGKPEDFADLDNNNNGLGNSQTTNTNSTSNGTETKKRLFRNPDEKAIGGVCSGLAAYIGVDTVWVRLAMFLLIFFGGLTLWVYLVMWIIIPLAKTTADKLAMRGEPITIDNISKTIQEEANDLRNRVDKTNIGKTASDLGNTLGNVFIRVLGLFIIFIAISMVIGFCTSSFSLFMVSSNSTVSFWIGSVLRSTAHYGWAVLSFILVFGIPTFMFLYLGIKLLFRITYSNKWLNLSLGLIWLLGFIIGIYVTYTTFNQFSETSKVKETKAIINSGDTLIVKATTVAELVKQFEFENNDDIENELEHDRSGYWTGEDKTGKTILGKVNVDVVENPNDTAIEVVAYYEAKGSSKQEANLSAKNIAHTLKQVGNTITIDELFLINQNDKFRFQEVTIKIKVPVGKVVYLDKSLKYMLDDVDNVTNTWDGDMVNRRWKMTDKGFVCIDCKGIDTNNNKNNSDEDEEEEGSSNNKSENVKIDEKGIDIKDKDSHIQINSDGIKVSTPEKDIEITNDGTKKVTNKK